MTRPSWQALQKLKQRASHMLFIVGGAGFWIGDRVLHDIMHVNSFASEAIGTGGGLILILIGANIESSRKSSNPEQLDK